MSQSEYINSLPVKSCNAAIAVWFIAPPMGVPPPPRETPQAMASMMGRPALEVEISSSPAALSIATAIGQNRVTTAMLGRTVEKMVVAQSQTMV